jgi:hypothetical protein
MGRCGGVVDGCEISVISWGILVGWVSQPVGVRGRWVGVWRRPALAGRRPPLGVVLARPCWTGARWCQSASGRAVVGRGVGCATAG